jgi:hypothetical protein
LSYFLVEGGSAVTVFMAIRRLAEF